MMKGILGMYRYMNESKNKSKFIEPEDPRFQQLFKQLKTQRTFTVGIKKGNKDQFEKFISYVLEENDVYEEKTAKDLAELHIDQRTHNENLKLIQSSSLLI